MKVNKFRTKYERRDVSISFKDVTSMTDPQFKEDCSISGIIKRYGILPPVDTKPVQVDVSEIGDFEDCMRKVQDGIDHFNMLPSALRARFGNDPRAFFAFINDPANVEESIKLGLMEKRIEKKDVVEVLENISDKLTNVVTSQEKQA